MSKFIPRQIAPIIKAQQTKFPVLAVTGPRQSGKTTLLKELFSDYRYVTLENPNTRSFALEDPVAFLKNLKVSLKKSGKLFIEVPSRDDALINLYGLQGFKDFYYQSAHLWYFNGKSLEYVLNKAGFGCEMVPVQRYDTSNHLVWLRDKKPGGNGFFSTTFSKKFRSEYEFELKRNNLTDTIMAVATVG